MVSSRSTLVDNTEQLLGDSTNAVFTDTDVGVQLDAAVKEASTYVPLDFPIWQTARAKSRAVTCTRDGLHRSGGDYACFPVLRYDSDGDLLDDDDMFRNKRNIKWSFGGFNLSLDSAPSPRDDAKLTGTVTFTSGSTAVSGSGTAFTTELKVGYYIRKSGSDEWYRVASITDATNLVLGRNSEDDGADSAGATQVWKSDVVLFADQDHVLNSLADTAGAIDAGVATGYAEWSHMIHVDALGTGTIPEGTFLTIDGTDGVYRVTAEATITTNEADLYIEPPLKDRAVENAVVTLYPSSLNPQLERIISELAAAQLAMNWTYDARTLFDTAVTDMADAETETDLANPEVDQALTDTDTARTSHANTVPVGGGIGDYLNLAQIDNTNASGYLQTAAGHANLAAGRVRVANLQLNLYKLGQDRYARAIRELMRMRKSRVYRVYSGG